MYGLPENINLSFLEQKTLLQVCIGAHDLILNLDERIRVTVTSAVGFASPKIPFQRHDDFRQAASFLVNLLNKNIVSAGRENADTLRLGFDGGETVFIYDDSKQYESFVIKNGDQVIVV